MNYFSVGNPMDILYNSDQLNSSYETYDYMILQFENRLGGYHFVIGQIIENSNGSTNYNITYDPYENLNLIYKDKNDRSKGFLKFYESRSLQYKKRNKGD